MGGRGSLRMIDRRTFCIHWPAGRVTDDRAVALAAALDEHPGGDPVRIVGGHRTLNLGVFVDSRSPGLARAVHDVTGGGSAHVLDPAELWPDDVSTVAAGDQ